MNSDDPYRNWPHAVLIAIDQLGNAIAGGHPVTTISARVGYFSVNAQKGKFFWKILERIINFAFYPVDGDNHCYKAWKKDRQELFRIGSDLTRIFLSIIILVATPFIAVALRMAMLFKPAWKY